MLKKLFKKIWTKQTQKILKYIWKPAWVTTIIGSVSVLIFLLLLLVTGNFITFIMATDIKYNSPIIHYLIVVMMVYAVFTLMYGVSLCLYKYNRQKKKEGTSYKALGEYVSGNK